MLNILRMSFKKLPKIIGILVFLLPLYSCGNADTNKLQQDLDLLRKKADVTDSNIHKIVILAPDVVFYQKGSRSPFEIKSTAVGEAQDVYPLYAFSLDNLRLVGTIADKKIKRAVIMTPDKKIYQVNVGDRLGTYGTIIKIDKNSIEVSEVVNHEDKKHFTRRIVSLQLKE